MTVPSLQIMNLDGKYCFRSLYFCGGLRYFYGKREHLPNATGIQWTTDYSRRIIL